MEESTSSTGLATLRLILAGGAVAIAALFLSFFLSPSSASASENPDDNSLLGGIGSLVSGVAAPVSNLVGSVVSDVGDAVDQVASALPEPVSVAVTAVTAPVVETLPENLVSEVVTPVAGAVDAVIGGIVDEVPGLAVVTEPILGTAPVHSLLFPVTQLGDSILGGVIADVAGPVAGVVSPPPGEAGATPGAVLISAQNVASAESAAPFALEFARVHTVVSPAEASGSPSPGNLPVVPAPYPPAAPAIPGSAFGSGGSGPSSACDLAGLAPMTASRVSLGERAHDDALPAGPVSVFDSTPD